MAVAFRTGTSSGNATNVSSINAAVPAGAAVGDIAVVFLGQWQSGATPVITAPSGFAQKGSTWTSGDAAAKNSIWWKRLTAADTGNYAFSWTGGSFWTTAQCALFSGCATSGDPWDAVATPVTGTFGSVTSMSVTMTDASGGLFWAVYNDTAGTHTPPTNFTEIADADSGSCAYRIPGASGSQAASGASISSSSVAGAWLGALLSDGGGGGTPTTPGTVTYVATNTPAPVGNTTSANADAITPTLPTGTASGDRVFVVQAGTNTNGGTPANWTAVAVDTQVGPTGTAPGAGTGRRYLSVFYRDYDGAWSMPAFSLTSATQNTNACTAITLRKGATDTWSAPTVSTAGNTSAATTAYSVTTGSLATGVGMLLVGTATNDNVTASAESLSQTGATLANLAERADTGSATGNDVSIKAYTADVTTGATATLTHAATLSGASEGGSIVVAQASTAAASTALWPRRRGPNYRR